MVWGSEKTHFSEYFFLILMTAYLAYIDSEVTVLLFMLTGQQSHGPSHNSHPYPLGVSFPKKKKKKMLKCESLHYSIFLKTKQNSTLI